MPDAAPEIKPPPQFKPAETLAFGGKAEGSVLQRPEVKAAQERAEQLREQRKKGATGKDVFERVAGRATETRISGQDIDVLKLRFGAGETKREADGSLTGPQSEEAKLSFESAQKTIDGISNFLQYSEITLEAQRTGKPIDRILNERRDKNIPGPRNTIDFQRLRENALDTLLNLDAMQEMLPELKDITDAGVRRGYLEATLASDPKLRTKVVEKMKGIQQNAEKFTEIQKDPDLEAARKTKEDAEKQVSEGADEIAKALDEIGISDTDVIKTQLQKMISEGMSLDSSMRYLRGNLLNEQRIPALREITTYYQAKNAVETLERELAGYNTRQTPESLIKTKQDALDKARETTSQFEESLKNDPNLQTQLELYVEVSRLTTTQKETSGLYLSPVAEKLNDMVGAKRKINESQKTITEKEAQASEKEKKQRQARLREEADAINQLDQVLSGSIAEVMMERYDEMVQLEEQRMTQEEEKTAKEKGEKVAEGVKAVNRGMRENWISYDVNSRTKTVNRTQIGEDERMIAYQGAEGAQRLMLRDLNFKDANGQPINWRTVDLSTLPEDQKDILNQVYSTQGEAYVKKLMASYFAARNWTDKTVKFFGYEGTIGDLSLKSHEWQLLEQNFPNVLQEGLKNSQDSQNVLKALEAKGIRPSSKLKWLLWLLAALGAGTLGFVAAGPLGGLAAGAGAGGVAAGGIDSGRIDYA